MFCFFVFFFIFYEFNLNIQGFVYLEFVKYQFNWASIETCKFSRTAMHADILYTDMSWLSSYIEINHISSDARISKHRALESVLCILHPERNICQVCTNDDPMMSFYGNSQIFVLVTMAILEEFCMTPADMQWLFYSVERIVAHWPLVTSVFPVYPSVHHCITYGPTH